MNSFSYVFVLLVFAFGRCEKPSNCRTGWLKGQGSCYLLEDDDQSWSEARSTCDFMGAKLVKIETSDEHTFLKTAIQNKFGTRNDPSSGQPMQFWTGGNQFQQKGTWMWSKDEAVSYTGWSTGAPGTADNHNCLMVDAKTSYAWMDNDCALKRNFICEIELSSDSPFGR